MKNRFQYSMAFVFAIIVLGYNNCGRIKFVDDQSSLQKINSNETIVGNPMTAAAKTVMENICAVVTRCHSDVTFAQCESGVMSSTGINYQLGLPVGKFADFASVLSAESAGSLAASSTAVASCSAAVAKLQCSDSSVQAAYDSASQSFAGLAFMIPTAPGSCPAIFSAPPDQSDYYVATTGADTNDGSIDHPWATIDHAAVAAKLGPTGTTIHVASGTYSVASKPNCSSNSASCGIYTSRSGLSGAPLIFMSDEQWGAKIIAPKSSATWYNAGDYVQIIGFEVMGTTDSNFGIFNEAAFVQVIGNHIHNIPVTAGCANNSSGGGIFFGYLSNSHDNDALGNLIHDIGPRLPNGLPASSYCAGMANGIMYDQPRGRVQNNIIYSSDSWGIATWHFAKQLKMSHNLLFNNGSRTSTGTTNGGAIFMSGEANVSVHDDTTVSNNIIRNNGGKGVAEWGSVGTHNAYLNNVMFSNGQDYSLISGAVPSGTVTSDPLMVNFQLTGGGDYHLQPNSPLVDRGTSNCAIAIGNGNCTPSTDFSGSLRVFGSASDIGPYEWHP